MKMKKKTKKCFEHFRYCFPFGRPEGSLKATLSLLERVLMKDIVTPVPPDEVRSMIKKSLETAAFVNYTRLSSEAKIEGNFILVHLHLLHTQCLRKKMNILTSPTLQNLVVIVTQENFSCETKKNTRPRYFLICRRFTRRCHCATCKET